MGVNEAFQLFVGACLSGITIIYFLVFYMGKREHKARWIIIYMTIQILSNWIIKMYRGYGHDERIMIVLYIVGFLYMFVGISRWSDKKRYMHIVAIIIYFFLEGITLTIANYVEMYVFNIPYAVDEILPDMGEFWKVTIIEFIVINVECAIAVFLMNKLFNRKRLYNDLVGKRMYWMSQAIIMLITDIIFMHFNPDINTTFLIKFMVLYSVELMTVSYIYKGAANIYKKREITYINSLFQVQREIYDNMYKRYNTLRDVKHDMGNYVRTMELIGANDIASSGKSVDREQLEETYKVDLEDKIGYVDTNTYTKYSMVNEYLEEIAMYCNREKLTVDIQADIEELSEDKEMILCIVLKSIFTEMIEGRVYNIEDKDRDIRLEIRCKGSIDIKATTSLNYTKNKDDKIKKKVKESKKILNYTRDIYDGKIIRDKNGIELNIL